MIGRIHAGGGNFGGLIAYLTHDAGTEADPRPDTDERVGFTEVENLVPCSGELDAAARLMAATVRDADALKQLAGVHPSGRRLQKPVYHFSLSWAPDENPTRAEMLIAAQGSLRSLGMGDRQAVVIEHRDRPHPHVHVVVNRVSPEDGRAASTSHDARTLSTWARQWELEPGELRCGRGTDRAPSDPPAERRRCPGRRDRSPAERRQWTELYRRHRAEQVADGGSEGQELPRRHALERVTLARKLERDRELDAALRRFKDLASFPGAQDAARELFDQRHPGWEERDTVSVEVIDGALNDIEAQVDKSLDEQEADLQDRNRFEARDHHGRPRAESLMARAGAEVLGPDREPANRQERAQVLNAADRLDVAERAIGAALSAVARHGITPSHRTLQAVAKDSPPWGRDTAAAIAGGRVSSDCIDHELETEHIRAEIQTLDEEAAAKDAEAARQKADEEYARAGRAWEQLSFIRRAVTPKPERRKPKAPEPLEPPTPERIESYRDTIARVAERAIRNVIQRFQPQLDPELRSKTFQDEVRAQEQSRQQPEMRSQEQSRQQPEQNRGRNQGGRSL